MLNVDHLIVNGDVMYRCLIHEMLTEKLQNWNSFFTMHPYPPFLKFRQRQSPHPFSSGKDKEFTWLSQVQSLNTFLEHDILQQNND